MKKFKEILSLIAEAKMEPGGQDAGKLFGPRGKYSPEKAKIKEKTFKARAKSGEINISIDRPSGLETTLGTHPPENAQFIEPPANQRAKGKRIIDRFITPHHPGIPEPESKKKPESKPKRSSKPTRPDIGYADIAPKHGLEGAGVIQPSKRSATWTPKIIPFTNNEPENHDLADKPDIKGFMKRMTPEFRAISQHLTNTTHEFYRSAGGRRNLHQYERNMAAQTLVDSHFQKLKDHLYDLHDNDGGFPIDPRFGKKAKLTEIRAPHQEHLGTRTLELHFSPFKTHISSTSDLDVLVKHLTKHTGHQWYLHPRSGTYMVGKNTPVILATDINHPDLDDELEWDGDNDRDGGIGGGDDERKPKPKSPSGKKPSAPVPTPTRPKAPALT